MSKWIDMELGKAIQFNPSERIAKGKLAKKIPMEKLTAYEKKIIGFEFAEYSAGPKFRNGDTLVAKITPCLENGKTAQVDILENDEVAFGSSEFIVLRQNENSINDFIFYLAKSPAFRKRAIGCMEGTSGRKRVNEGALKLQVLPIPDKTTQKKIAFVLSALDSKIELNNRINAELEAMAKTLYDYWFVQFDFPNAEGKPYKTSGGTMVWNEELKRDIPEGWKVKSLAEITAVSNESINPMDSPDKEFKYYSIPGFDTSGTFAIEKGEEIKSNKFKVEATDVLVSKLNPWFSRVIYSTDDSNLVCSTEFVVWRTSDIAIKNYMYMIARDASFVTYCTQSASGTSNSHKRVNPTVMMKYQIVYNDKIARLFGTTLGSTIKMYAKNQIENQQLSALRDWLLPMLMNGQVKVGETTNIEVKKVERNSYPINMQKLLHVARELHLRGYEKLRVVPSLSTSGMSWRCSFVTDPENEIVTSTWLSEYSDNEREIEYSINELTDIFEREHMRFLESCKGKNKDYVEWYQNMLSHLEEDELPYAFAEYFSPTDYWKTTNDQKIETLPNEKNFYYGY